jgi:hypothetical protein
VFEVLVACGLLSYLLLLALPGIAWQFIAGTALGLVGLLGGGGAGVVYHLMLRKALTRLGILTQRWLWSPVACHRLLDEQGRHEVLPWFRVGAAGFLLCLAGIGMVAVAVVKSAFAD